MLYSCTILQPINRHKAHSVDAEEELLPRHLIHEIFEYIHTELKSIIHREGNAFFDNKEKRLPLSLIMNSGLESMVVPGTGRHAMPQQKRATGISQDGL